MHKYNLFIFVGISKSTSFQVCICNNCKWRKTKTRGHQRGRKPFFQRISFQSWDDFSVKRNSSKTDLLTLSSLLDNLIWKCYWKLSGAAFLIRNKRKNGSKRWHVFPNSESMLVVELGLGEIATLSLRGEAIMRDEKRALFR